jgi:hypothetical protein
MRRLSKIIKSKSNPETKMGVGQMIEKRKLLGSMKKGGMVKATGAYLLHKGEKVVPAKDVKKVMAAMKKK